MEQNNKAQNLRFIIVTALVGLVILGIAIWAITFVVNSGKKTEVSSAETTSSALTSNTPAATSDPSAMPSAVATDASAANDTPTETTEAPTIEGVVVTTPPAVETVAETPYTGPEEILPVALVAGTGVAYALSRRF